MAKPYTLIHPDIDRGCGRTRELIDELVASWREGRNEGAGEICAALEVLADDEMLVEYFKFFESSPQGRLSREFASFLARDNDSNHPFLVRVGRDRGQEQLNVNAVAMAGATGALWAVLRAVGVEDREVVVTSLNYPGVINAVITAGARPRFVDINADTWCADPEDVKSAIGENTRAIVLTHINRYVDPEPFYDMTEAAGISIPVVQDASLAVGSSFGGLRPGIVNIGRQGATIFSTTISKIVCGLGGGIVTSADSELLMRALACAHQGQSLSDPYVLQDPGSNFKLGAANAAIAIENLKRSHAFIERRRALRTLYDDGLARLVGEGRLALQALDDGAVLTHYGVLLPQDKFAGRKAFCKLMHDKYGIQIGIWHCHHMQGIYRRFSSRNLPNTEAIADRLVFLPFHTRLSDSDVSDICKAMEENLLAPRRWLT